MSGDCVDDSVGSGKGAARVLFTPNPVWEHHFRKYPPAFDATFRRLDTPGLAADDYDAVVALSLEAARWLNQPDAAAFARKALVPSDKVMAVCDDKLAFVKFLVGNGLGAHVPKTGGDLPYPYILKRRTAEWGQHTHLIRTAADEMPFQDDQAAGTVFRQEYVPGLQEYALHMLVVGQQVTFARTVEYTFAAQHHIHRHDHHPIGRRWVNHSRHYGFFARILGWLGYEGYCCFNYKLAGDQVKIFELNPRPGATLRFAADAALAAYVRALDGIEGGKAALARPA